ncbi:hypothetical protein HSTV1_38 [Haloarcula sinaiiensis tailed virus 1]|uniref:Uncharacterized protein n=1 Tax=Haloarcula sinaiiensis tailed virus 1 TaxID=1262530 RepID=R9QT41_9CAUD|nr:hypothetical protein HSTV1_38 [Haloarcula sinaiiensis tailed virus 1]AGC34583.1 hypothetical protein HSTV1_38 [Haloarcula sinaiiensis tailed virus 1]
MTEREDSRVTSSKIGESFVVFDRDNNDAWPHTCDSVDIILSRQSRVTFFPSFAVTTTLSTRACVRGCVWSDIQN